MPDRTLTPLHSGRFSSPPWHCAWSSNYFKFDPSWHWALRQSALLNIKKNAIQTPTVWLSKISKLSKTDKSWDQPVGWQYSETQASFQCLFFSISSIFVLWMAVIHSEDHKKLETILIPFAFGHVSPGLHQTVDVGPLNARQGRWKLHFWWVKNIYIMRNVQMSTFNLYRHLLEI